MTYVNSNIAELWPAEGMVEVVFAEVVLWQVSDVGLLNMRDVRGAEEANIHRSNSLCASIRSIYSHE